MNVLAIIGSPNGMKGNTGRLLSAVLEGAQAGGAQVDVCSLAELDVEPCDGCSACHRTGRCAIVDDLDAVADPAAQADAIVLASPNYIFNVSAQTKAFLDRCCGPLHCQAWHGKYGAAVVTSGGGGGEEVAAYLLRFLRAMGCATVGSIVAEGRHLAGGPGTAQVMQQAQDLGARLAESVRSRAVFPEQAAERAAFMVRMRGLVTMQKDVWPFEYEYWKSHGRL